MSMDMQQIKQMLMMKMMVGGPVYGQPGQRVGPGVGAMAGAESSMFDIAQSMIGIMLVGFVMSIVSKAPDLFNGVKNWLIGFCHNRLKRMQSKVGDKFTSLSPSPTVSIKFVRNYKSSPSGRPVSDNVGVTDSIIEYLTNLTSVNGLKFLNFYVMDNFTKFQVTNRIDCQVQQVLVDEDGVLTCVSFTLSSQVLSIVQLRQWVDNIYNTKELAKKNSFNSQKFFFDEYIKTEGGRVGDVVKRAPFLTFTSSVFETTKSFDNLFGEHVDHLKKRVDLFLDGEWYKRVGIPHTLGILMHGAPGCGKTSMIKAIANYTNRHVVNIKLTPKTTKSQLRELFYSPSLHIDSRSDIYKGGNTVLIPNCERIYVLEDIDCAGSAVAKRVEPEEMKDYTHTGASVSADEELTHCKGYSTESPDSGFLGFAEGKEVATHTSKSCSTNLETYVQRHCSPTPDPNAKLLPTSENYYGQKTVEKPAQGYPEDPAQFIDLSFLLNLLDGILETPGRIIIMTTNFIEKLDRALIRPGRVDVEVEFVQCSVKVICQMAKVVFGKDVFLEDRLVSCDMLLTPACVQEILCSNIYDSTLASKKLLRAAKRVKKERYAKVDRLLRGETGRKNKGTTGETKEEAKGEAKAEEVKTSF
jgi:hypothetical protein